MRADKKIKTAPAVRSKKLSPTEQRNPRSIKLDKMSTVASVQLMLSEEAKVTRALSARSALIAKAVNVVARAFQNGGRLFYFGAGTSGRLGVLDASECPPTFRTAPEMVQGIIAGGDVALRRSVEGAEDDAAAGAREVRLQRVGRNDVVVGIAASGTTPFVWGALAEAKKRDATAILICFNPHLKIPPMLRPKIIIAPDLGPEVLTGSTRLKCGTATKLILNMLTTLAMVRVGKVMSNLMVDVLPGNAKLRDRAMRIVCDLTRDSYAEAKAALETNGWVIRKAVARRGRK
ncbi:MAG: N-acetylmuramic acid 6-phosphate etherase [Verrucomicrobia bacterium]|nr:N-acetylmuramic acid 6-phosphate etherase [Verrucomicrobiota bacterium]